MTKRSNSLAEFGIGQVGQTTRRNARSSDAQVFRRQVKEMARAVALAAILGTLVAVAARNTGCRREMKDRSGMKEEVHP